MRNQPKYNFFKNTNYAISGLCEIVKNESSFKIELVIIAILSVCSLFLKLSVALHIILIVSLLLVLLTECLNSAIERCVDLTTTQIHPLAKAAKDAGSAAVFISICITVISWGFVLFELIFGLA
ncbi:diacylglycerol kinase [Campylobacter geochelonis]|uniref:Diacylglycerol kinase n=1 Tax=Campylobacter geochelonis TaxID=1780362 RepID=A0A128EDV5_9BACT|nr:diacylglycerol kinase [Campylobacter geochelonis]QKF70390.1 diacylglycerol kinase [Campylobacter geochelonis]CZE46383.1 diacylglycerol kinase [Campylobacter geochelonis]